MQADLLANLKAIVSAVWTDAAANGIYYSVQLARIEFAKIEKTRLPAAFLKVSLQPGDGGIVSRDVWAENGEIHIGYMAEQADIATVEDLVGKLEAMRSYLCDNRGDKSVVAFDFIEWPAIEWDEDSACNPYFIAHGKPYVSGVVRINAAFVSDEP